MASVADALGIGRFAVMAAAGAAELWLRPDDGHVSVLDAAEAALDWLRDHARQG